MVLTSENISVGAVGFVSAIVAVGVGRWRENLQNDVSGRLCKVSAIPDDCKWLDQASFEVLTAICDAMIPSYNSELDCSTVQLEDELLKIASNLPEDCAININNLTLKRKNLLRGAVEARTHILVADTLQTFAYRFDQFQLHFLLRFLGTSLGCYLLCGFPVPYQRLPLKFREIGLGRIRDSSLADIRAAYQNFKRLTGNIFNAYAERGTLNPQWALMQYDPHSTVNKPPPPMQMLGDSQDTFLRKKMCYEHVLKELQSNCPRTSSSSSSSSSSHATAAAVDTIDIDVVVVGSGAGGGTIATQLVEAGLNVLVLEKGGYFRADDFRAWRESEAMQHIYERSGLCTSADGNIVILAGSCVGGGSTVNWSASFRTPQSVRDEWVRSGLTDFREGGVFDDSLNAVHKMINVNSDCSHRTTTEEEAATLCGDSSAECSGAVPFAVNNNNRLLWEGATRLGYKPEKIPRNVKQCVDCGHCTHGCPYESKQSTATAMMEPLLLQQASHTPIAAHAHRGTLHVLPDCDVRRVLYETLTPTETASEGASHEGDYNPTKRAVGVEAVVTIYPESDQKAFTRGQDGDKTKLNRPKPIGTRKLIVTARIVVSSAGAIHTPALLLRSKFTHPMIGKHITLHPVLGAAGLFPENMNTGLGSGVSMGVVVRTPAITANTQQKSAQVSAGQNAKNVSDAQWDDEESHAAVVETPPVHPGLLGLMLPWQNGKQFKISCLAHRNIAIFIAITRDRSHASNRVVLNAEGQPVIQYKITDSDKPMLMAGSEASLRMLYAAGACVIFIGHENFPWFVRETVAEGDADGEQRNADRFEAYLEAVRKEGIQQSKVQVFSAHQMSSCRMSLDPTTGCVRPTGEMYECANLFVADASVFPTALGINPMVTVEAFAHMIAAKVVNKLKASHSEADSGLKAKVLAAERAMNSKQW